MNSQFITEDSDSFGSAGLADTRSSHRVGYLWSSNFHSISKIALILSMLSQISKQILDLT